MNRWQRANDRYRRIKESFTTWRVRDGEIQPVDTNAKDFSTFPPAPEGVQVADEGGFDSRWCAKNAALSP